MNLGSQRGNHMKRIFGSAIALISALAVNASAATPEAVPGEYVVKLKDGLMTMNRTTLSQSLRSYVKSKIPGQNIVVIQRPTFELEQSVVKSLSQNPMVDIIEPNYIYRINKLPNDPKLDLLWGMKNFGQEDSARRKGVAGVDIGAEQAWDIQTGSRDVVVAVIDTGVNYNHPDIAANAWTNEIEANGKPGVDDDGNGYIDDIHGYNFVNNTGDPMDDHGHGTHCSGTIGAKGDDGQGIVGVAWNVRIMGVKFLSAQGGGTLEDAIKAIDYATKMGAKIMSNSWGGGGFSETLKQAIERANAKGALFVAAAGNETNNNDASPTYPATYNVPNVLAVAAVDNSGQLASFSNWGKTTVHVGAPGVNIYSSVVDGYDSWSGTSMATPHVSGVAALLVSNEPALTNVEMKERITNTARPISGLKNKVKSGGLVNAYAVLTNTMPEPDPNDPDRWASAQLQVSSEHPYKAKSNVVFEIRQAGAKEMALYFTKFDLERGYDFVDLFDEAGNKIYSMTGNNNESYSPVIKGEYVKVVLRTDESVQRYGFDITKVSYR